MHIFRVGLGYLFIIFYFSLVWKYFAIEWVWLLGALLLLLFTITTPGGIKRVAASLRDGARSYGKIYVAILAISNVFFLPCHISQNYGPFTESGGDITVYADTAKYLVENHLPAFGLQDVISDATSCFYTPLDKPLINHERISTFDPVKGNPPSSELTSYLIWLTGRYPTFQFAPTGLCSGITRQTNYQCFFGTLAFLYSGIVLFAWGFFRKWGRLPAIMAAGLAATSLGLVSVPYNCYLMQTISIFILSLFFAMVIQIPLLSRYGFLYYLPSIGIVLASYPHYAAVLLPFAIVARWTQTPTQHVNPSCFNPYQRSLKTYTHRIIILIFFLLTIPVLCVDILTTSRDFIFLFMEFVHSLSSLKTVSSNNPYFGTATPIFSQKFFEMTFGFFSQQHYAPFVAPHPFLSKIALPYVYFASFSILVGFGIWLNLFRSRQRNAVNLRSPFLIYCACGATILLSIFLTKSTLYTQAKGSQNVLPALYCFILLPFAVFNYSHTRNSFKSKCILIVLPALLALLLLFPRFTFLEQMAYSMERSAILDASFFQEAERIRKEDNQPFVLVEPRKSADVYFFAQPFFQVKAVPTKDLILQSHYKPLNENIIKKDPLPNIASDFFSTADLPHLWRLFPVEIGSWKSYFSGPAPKFTWVAEKVIDILSPRLLLFANYYQYRYHQFERFGPGSDMVWFSYLRNGAAQIFLPMGGPYVLEIWTAPRGNSTLADILGAITPFLVDNYSTTIETHQNYVHAITLVPSLSSPEFITLLRINGECILHLRINDRDILAQ